MKNKNENKQIICAALGWLDVDYQLYQFEVAYEYLEKKIVLPERISKIHQTRTWWMWWHRQWDIIDREIVSSLNLNLDNCQNLSADFRVTLTELYQAEHSPEEMKAYLSRPAKHAIEAEINGKLTIKQHGNNSH